MGRKAEQIAALEAECSALVKERDGYRRALADAHREAETPSLVDQARSEFRAKWSWLAEAVGL